MPCWPPSGSSWAPSTCSGPTSGCGRGPWSGRRPGPSPTPPVGNGPSWPRWSPPSSSWACSPGRCANGSSRRPSVSSSRPRPRVPDPRRSDVHPLAQATTQPLPVPQVDWRAIAPELALLVAGGVLLLGVACRAGSGRSVLAGVTLAGLAVAAALTAWNWDLERVAFEGAVSLDGITRYATAALLARGALAPPMSGTGHT